MLIPEKHLFICTRSRSADHPLGSCAAKGGDKLMGGFVSKMGKRDLLGRFQVTSTGCMGLCNRGAVVLVYPEAVMYCNVKDDDINAIIDEHLLGGKPVKRLLAPTQDWTPLDWSTQDWS